MFVVIIGAVAVLGGFILGMMTVSVSPPPGTRTVECGSAFSLDTERLRIEDRSSGLVGVLTGDGFDSETPYTDACKEAIGPRPWIAWGLVITGAVAVAGGLLVRTRRPA